MRPEVFEGARSKVRGWGTRMKAFANGIAPGFRKAMVWAERHKGVIDKDTLLELSWPHAQEADGALYDMLMCNTDGEPQGMVASAPGEESGFEAWRILMSWYDACNANNETDIVNSLINIKRVKEAKDLPHAINMWEKEWSIYVEKTGEKLPERWRSTLLMKLVPSYFERAINMRYNKGGVT